MTHELAGKTIVITAGPTYEDLDPVRFLGNRSSGQMGFAVAQAAADVGATVVLVAGPCQQTSPANVQRINVRSALQMREQVMQQLVSCDVFIGCAAVADYRPLKVSDTKIKKDGSNLTLQLVQNPDILAEVASAESDQRPFSVGFAAETNDIEKHALRKLRKKNLDMIAANQVGEGQGFDCSENALLLLYADGRKQALPCQAKCSLGCQLIDEVGAEYARLKQTKQ